MIKGFGLYILRVVMVVLTSQGYMIWFPHTEDNSKRLLEIAFFSFKCGITVFSESSLIHLLFPT